MLRSSTSRQGGLRRLATAALACAALLAGLLVTTTSPAAADDPPVGVFPSTLVMIKGWNALPAALQAVGCDSADADHQFFRPSKEWITTYQLPYTTIDTLQTYDNDVPGTCTGDIRHWGPNGNNDTSTSAFNPNTPIEELAYHTAWYLYFNYWLNNKVTDIEAHSMGGLVVRYMIQAIALPGFDPGRAWPPYNKIRKIVTLATPHAGVCGASVPAFQAAMAISFEAVQLECNSAFISHLNMPSYTSTGGAEWFTVGTLNDDILGYGDSQLSSVGFLLAQHRGTYGNPPNYEHGPILDDQSLAKDATFTWISNEPQSSTCVPSLQPRSLNLVFDFFTEDPGYTPGHLLCTTGTSSWEMYTYRLCDRLNTNYGMARSLGNVSDPVTFVRALSAKGVVACLMRIGGVDSAYVQFADTTLGARPRVRAVLDYSSQNGPWPTNPNYSPFVKKPVGNSSDSNSWWTYAQNNRPAPDGTLFSVASSSDFDCTDESVTIANPVAFGAAQGCQMGNPNASGPPDTPGTTLAWPLKAGGTIKSYGTKTYSTGNSTGNPDLSYIGLSTATDTSGNNVGTCTTQSQNNWNVDSALSTMYHATGGYRTYFSTGGGNYGAPGAAIQYSPWTYVTAAPDNSLVKRRSMAGCSRFPKGALGGTSDAYASASGTEYHNFFWMAESITGSTSWDLARSLAFAFDPIFDCSLSWPKNVAFPPAIPNTYNNYRSSIDGRFVCRDDSVGDDVYYAGGGFPLPAHTNYAAAVFARLDGVEFASGPNVQLTIAGSRAITGGPGISRVPATMAIYAAP